MHMSSLQTSGEPRWMAMVSPTYFTDFMSNLKFTALESLYLGLRVLFSCFT